MALDVMEKKEDWRKYCDTVQDRPTEWRRPDRSTFGCEVNDAGAEVKLGPLIFFGNR